MPVNPQAHPLPVISSKPDMLRKRGLPTLEIKEKVNKEIVKELFVVWKMIFSEIFSSSYCQLPAKSKDLTGFLLRFYEVE
ncbi:hypothetical protein [Methanosarcina sp. 1.H.T.1A.1]|uniref:hypothetical protein n=1 Tax=Methanosarcina sp. 1.H.T.1A.1 TaxID=1483602 RepID=UPI0012DFEEEF|nr:hypothetical protein [Methanosarcina sp. 1.H.T.1A.1]